MDLSIYLWYYSAVGIYFSFRWGPFVHSLEIIQWDSTRRDHPGYPGRVSGLGLVSNRLAPNHMTASTASSYAAGRRCSGARRYSSDRTRAGILAAREQQDL